MTQYRLLNEYTNGNYNVKIFNDGTKIRYSDDDDFVPQFPESIDLKITNNCDLNCPMCHESSSSKGKHGDLNHPFFNSLHKGTELALGGGNPLIHPDLISFLSKMKERGIICNITVNQVHFVTYYSMIKELIRKKLIHGLGISITSDIYLDKIIKFAKTHHNCILHVIIGIIDKSILDKLANNDLKLLILGYKNVGKGKSYIPKNYIENLKYLKQNIIEIADNFLVVSFDNKAIIQLELKNKIANYETYYMGDDGQFTMYIDLVNKKYALSSVSNKLHKLQDNIIKMFDKIKKDRKVYYIEYYLSLEKNKILYATLKQDYNYTFYYDKNENKWVFTNMNFNAIKKHKKMELVDKNLAAFITMGNFVDDLYESMFGLNIYQEKHITKDSVDDFVNSLVDFAKSHHINNLSINELESAYNCGFVEMMKENYDIIINRKDKYPFMKIKKESGDYIICFDDSIFK